jgi:hypothetical protein
VQFVRHDRRRHPVLQDIGVTVLRATRSIVVIVFVVLLVSAIRDRGVHWEKLQRVAWSNRALFVAVFLALLIWDYWFQRMRRVRSEETQENIRPQPPAPE